MAICWEFRITHSEFLSWDENDRAKTVAYFMEKNERCQLCGTAPWEWDPKQGGNRFAYEAVGELCQGCLHRAVANEQIGQSPGVNVILKPTNTPEHAKRMKRAEENWKEG